MNKVMVSAFGFTYSYYNVEFFQAKNSIRLQRISGWLVHVAVTVKLVKYCVYDVVMVGCTSTSNCCSVP